MSEKDYINFEIDKVFISHDKTMIVMQNIESQKSLVLEAQGECCSDSWIEHTCGVSILRGSRVVKLEEIGTINMFLGTKQEDDKVYGYKLFVQRDRTSYSTQAEYYFSIEMRNSSNGMYGGSIEIFVKDGLELSDDMVSLIEDF